MADYGTDVAMRFAAGAAAADIDPTFALVSGRAALVQACARRLLTARGSLLADPDYGFDIRLALGDGLTPARRFALETSVANEVRKDERVASARARVTNAAATGALVVRVEVLGEDDAEPFALTLSVSALTVELLRVEV